MKLRNLSAIGLAVMLVAVACTGGTASPTPGAGTQAPATQAPATQAPATQAPATPGDSTAICAADAHGCVEYGPGDPVRIAAALSITGETANLGLDSQYGMQVAADLHGPVMGHEIEIFPSDAGCGNAADGQTAAQEIVAQGNIAAAVGTTCSRTAVPAIPVLGRGGILLVSPSNTAVSLTDPNSPDHGGEFGDFFARTAHNDKVQGGVMADFACNGLEATTAATIHDGSPYAEQLQQVFVDQFQELCGGTITAQEAVNVGDTQFGPLLQTIAAGSPEFVFFPVFNPEGGLIAKQARETEGLGDAVVLAGSDGIHDTTFLGQAGEAAEGMYISGPDTAFAGSFYADTFLPAYRVLSGTEETLSVFHAHGFDATNMILEAIKQVAIEGADGSLFIPRQALRDAFFGIQNHQGITGNLTCDEFGDCADPQIIVDLIENGEFVKAWPE